MFSATLNPPKRGKFVTLKLSMSECTSCVRLLLVAILIFCIGWTVSGAAEYIHFNCIHGDHPLGNLIGTPAAVEKINTIREELRAGRESVRLNVNHDVYYEMRSTQSLRRSSRNLHRRTCLSSVPLFRRQCCVY